MPDGLRLDVAGLTCRRGERLLFSGLDFAAASGEIVWVRGPNGQGKTTLLRTLAGLSEAEAGSIAIAGGRPGPRRLYLAHANALKDDLSAGEALSFLLRLDGLSPSAAQIDAALQRFGVADRAHALVRSLSQGQRRRVALARLAGAPAPAVWLLDEPFDALDSAAGSALCALLVEHARRGGITVLASHVPFAVDGPVPIIVQLDPRVAA